MNEIEPLLTSFPEPPQIPTPPAAFDKSKLLIPGSILISGILIAATILIGQSAGSSGGPALVGNQTGQGSTVDVKIDDAPFLGDKNAPVTVVEFGDFQCPFCGRYHQNNLKPMITEYVNTGKVKFVWMDYAFLGPESQWSAQAARCSGEQGKFWEYHDYLYTNHGGENQGAFSVANLKKFAQVLGLDQGKFDSCLDSGKYQDAVSKDTQYGSSIGVTGTPASFINGRLIIGAVPYQELKAAIDAALQK